MDPGRGGNGGRLHNVLVVLATVRIGGQLQVVGVQARGAQLRNFGLLGDTVRLDTAGVDWRLVGLA